MRYSRLFGKTVREKPRNADAVSHELLLRAGFIRGVSGGAGFTLLPLGERALGKIGGLLAAELQGRGAQRIALPNGRRSASTEASRYLQFERRDAGVEYPWADQHESALGLLAGNLNLSYRELPVTLAAERWAARDDGRPNWGLLLAPDFLLAGAYLFCASEAALQSSTEAIETAVRDFADRIGVHTSWLDSNGGITREMVIATDSPARRLLACDACGWQADVEEAVSQAPEWPQDSEPGEMEAVCGPGLINVAPLSRFLGIPVHQTTKTLLFQAGERVVAACVSGVYDVSEKKLGRVLGVRRLGLAPAELVRELTQSEVGYAGPIGLPESVEVVWDVSTEHRVNFEAGANRTDHHLIKVNFGRDVARPERFFDIRASKPGERCAHCGRGALKEQNAITLAHISRLGTMYADRLGAMFLDSDKVTKAMQIGCAGVDLTACLAAIVEQRNDTRGILWPHVVAPYAAHLISLPPAEETAAGLYDRLLRAGVEVLWDDRPESAGVKFGDADLVGMPIRLVMSKRTGDRVEWKCRNAQESELLAQDDVVERLSGAGILTTNTIQAGEAR